MKQSLLLKITIHHLYVNREPVKLQFTYSAEAYIGMTQIPECIHQKSGHAESGIDRSGASRLIILYKVFQGFRHPFRHFRIQTVIIPELKVSLGSKIHPEDRVHHTDLLYRIRVLRIMQIPEKYKIISTELIRRREHTFLRTSRPHGHLLCISHGLTDQICQVHPRSQLHPCRLCIHGFFGHIPSVPRGSYKNILSLAFCSRILFGPADHIPYQSEQSSSYPHNRPP